MPYLVLGANGQTASYLIDKALDQKDQVIGISRSVRSARLADRRNYHHIQADLISPQFSLKSILAKFKPSTVVNLAALSSVSACELNPMASKKINYDFVVKSSREIMEYNKNSDVKVNFLQASSSEMFAGGPAKLINEMTPLSPKSTYGRHKAMAHEYIGTLDRSNSLSASCLILFNHESPRRPATFVSQKIVQAASKLSQGSLAPLRLGDTSVTRDWGYAKEYADAIYLQASSFIPSNYVIASGKLHSIFEFVERAFSFFKVPLNETTFQTDPTLFRRVENSGFAGDTSEFAKDFGWSPNTSFEELVKIMCRHVDVDDW